MTDDVEDCGTAEAAETAELAVRAAFEDTVQLESKLAGSAAARPAATADCANSRRVERKVECSSQGIIKRQGRNREVLRVFFELPMRYFAYRCPLMGCL